MELAKVKRVDFLYRIFFLKEAFLTFVIYLNVSCIEHTFRIYILLHIKKKITSYIFVNLVHNILELCNVLIQTRLTTSKTKRDINYGKLGSGVASGLKTEGNKEK